MNHEAVYYISDSQAIGIEKKNELFRFANQCKQSVYYFTETGLMKGNLRDGIKRS